MAVYIVTGKLGNGKTLVTVGRIRDALYQHRRVATNLDINLVSMVGKKARDINLLRIPDKPTIDDLNAIGKGYDGDYDESKFGLLVLDECGTWFNSRNWQDKTRKEVNEWFLHARKLGWDVYIIIQDISILDSQARDAIGEMLVVCRRLDNLRVPVIGAVVKLFTGYNLRLPRIHRAKVTYADGLLCDVWVYRGTDLFSCYDTRQAFIQSYPHGVHSLLSPWHTHGRYSIPLTWSKFMRLTKIHWKRFKSPVALMTGVLAGMCLMLFANARQVETKIQSSIPSQKIDKNFSVKSSAASSSASSQPSAQTKIAELFEHMRIIGSYKINNAINYTFSTGHGDQYYTSVDFKEMGYDVKPLGECAAQLAYRGVESTVSCL